MLVALSAYISPTTLLEFMVEHLITSSEDANVRRDDPQGSLTRFGEGVVLVETFAAIHEVRDGLD